MGRLKKSNIYIHYFSKKLQSKMDDIKNVRTTFIEAPSGYGKTTLVHEFIKRFPSGSINYLWFTAEEEHIEKGWSRFCNEINKIDKKSGCQLLNLGFPDDDTVGEIAQIFRSIVCDTEFFLVIDNFHYLQNKIPEGVWLSLIEHGGDKLHLIILTQLLSNKGSVIGNSNVLFINSKDLRLSKQDVQKYYAMAGIEISNTQAETLEIYTEGWIVALYLQMINYVELGQFSHTVSISNLIEDMIWAKLTEEECDFLLNLSQFRSFTIKQANYMLDIEISPSFVKELLKNNTFIQYEYSTHQYYIHNILLEFLNIKFQEKDGVYQKNILNKSGEWHKMNGQNLMAFKFFYSLKDYEKILSINLSDIEISQMDEVGFYETIINILHNCPYDIKSKHPIALIQIALELFGAGLYEQFGQLCGEIEIIIDNSGLTQIEKNKLYGELILLSSFLEFNDIEKMCLADKKAYDLINGSTSIISMTEPWTFGSPSVLYMFHREPGKLVNEVECLCESLPYYCKLTNGHGLGSDIVMKAEMLLYQGHIEEAEILSHKAAYISQTNKQDSIFLCSMMLLARVSILNGDFNGYVSYINQMDESLKHLSKKSNRMSVDIIKAFLSNSLNEPEAAQEWIKNGDINRKRLFDVAIPFAQMVYLKNLLLKKEYKLLIALSEEFLKNCEMLHFLLPQIYIKIYSAVAYYSLGSIDKAISLLKSAFNLALPDKLYLPFAENDELIGDLLAFTGYHSNDLVQIKSLSNQYQKGRAIIQNMYFKKELPYRLTEREFEIAKLTSVGFQNKEIAKKLFLSENTVKQYLKRIFHKLNINKRSDIKHIL